MEHSNAPVFLKINARVYFALIKKFTRFKYLPREPPSTKENSAKTKGYFSEITDLPESKTSKSKPSTSDLIRPICEPTLISEHKLSRVAVFIEL